MRKHTDKDIVLEFWKKVEKTPTCWLWTGYQTNNGYGRHYIGSQKRTVAHRFSYALMNGEISEDLNVCHTCDVRLCVNPEHLFLGTQKDNVQDMLSKGRGVKGLLTAEEVSLVRYSKLTNRELATRFNLHIRTIRGIKNRETYNHLP